jgi:hypothetical protein
MSLVKTPSTKQEGECHSSIFYGLFENEKMNERHVTTISNTAKNKGGSKQECVNLEAFFRFYLLSIIEEYGGCLFPFNGVLCIGVVVVCNVVENECGRRDAT